MAMRDWFQGSGEQPTQQSVDRRKRIAQALASIGQQGLQGQQVGRYYNAPSTGATIAGALSQIIGGYQSGKAEQEQGTVTEDRKRKIAEALSKVQGGGQNQAAMEALGTLPLEQQEAALAQGVSGKLFSKPKDPIKVGAGDVLIDPETKQPVYTAPKEEKLPEGMRKNAAGGMEYDPAYLEGQERLRAAGRPGATQVNVNTEKSLYGTLADKRAGAISDLASQAEKAPELIQRSRRVRELLGSGDVITGAGANQALAVAKLAAQLGFNTGDAAADTEALGRELAASTLDAIKSSGLGAGSGFSNADRDFLEKVTGGQITMEAKALARLAELNERAATSTIQRYNKQISLLQPDQLKTLGMGAVEVPASPEAVPLPSNSKLQRNPDGSYNYVPR